MKIFDWPLLGFTLKTEDLAHLYQGIQLLAQGFGQALCPLPDTVYRLSGGVWSVSGSVYSVSAGFYYYNGEVIPVGSWTGTVPGGQVPVLVISDTATADEPHALHNGTTFVGSAVIKKDRAFQIEIGTPGSGIANWNQVVEAAISQLSEIVNGLVSVRPGMIVNYSGPSAGRFDGTGQGINEYTGWAMCNGQNGTPDLRGRFVVGQADAAPLNGNSQGNRPEYFPIGATGGNREITLTVDQLPAHRHETIIRRDNQDYAIGGSRSDIGYAPEFGTPISTEETGGNQPIDIRPSFYVLAYLMRL